MDLYFCLNWTFIKIEHKLFHITSCIPYFYEQQWLRCHFLFCFFFAWYLFKKNNSVCAHVCVKVCMYRWRPGIHVGHLFPWFSTLLFKTRSFTGSRIQQMSLSWFVSKIQRASHPFPLPRQYGYRCVLPLPALGVCRGSELRSSCLPTEPSPQPWVYFVSLVCWLVLSQSDTS